MSDSEQRIRDMIRAAVEENPRVTNKDLFARAREIDADAVEGITLRQFHGRFRLPVSRALSAAESPAKPKKQSRPRTPEKSEAPAAASKHDAVRDIFRRFAVQLSRAEGRSEIVRAAARIDEFVEEVIQTFGGPDGTDGPEATRTRRRRRSPRAKGGEQSAASGEATATASTAADVPAPPPTESGEPPARDMRRRRRPKAMIQRAAEPEALKDGSTSAPDAGSDQGAGRPSEEGAGEPEQPLVFSLSHDLEEFRRRKYERERKGRLAP